MNNLKLCIWLLVIVGLFSSGCGEGDKKLKNPDPGRNNVEIVACFGDSITQGSVCACTPYPTRLAALINKSVFNSGVSGSMARENVGRTQEACNRYLPGFMIILYGVNDIIHGFGAGSTAEAVRQMVSICRQNQVVPVIVTYPIPIGDHQVFAAPTRVLNSRLRAVASEMSVPCVDLEKEFGGDPALYQPDGLHPNDAGTQVIALAVADLF